MVGEWRDVHIATNLIKLVEQFRRYAIRLAQFLEIEDNGIDNIPVNFYP